MDYTRPGVKARLSDVLSPSMYVLLEWGGEELFKEGSAPGTRKQQQQVVLPSGSTLEMEEGFPQAWTL